MDQFNTSRDPSPFPDDNEEGKTVRAKVTNMARSSVIEYHLAPTLPSTFSSMDELESVSRSSDVLTETKIFTPHSTGSSDYDEPFQSVTGNPSIPTIKIIGGGASSTIYKCISVPNLHAKPVSPLPLPTVPKRSGSPQASLSVSKTVGNKLAKSDESFWDKFSGTRHKAKQVNLLESEGRKAIEYMRNSIRFETSPEEYDLAEGEERFHIERKSLEDPLLLNLMQTLRDWINKEMAGDRIIVKSLDEDLYDGQILMKLFEKLTGEKLEAPEITFSAKAQKERLQLVLDAINRKAGQTGKWNTEMIFSKSLLATLHLLIHLAKSFKPEKKLPDGVSVEIIVVRKENGILNYRRIKENLTGCDQEEKDPFDTLMNEAPEKMPIVTKGLIDFANQHLKKLNLEVKDLEYEFHDGVYLILLMGIVENYFVPIYEYHLSPRDHEQKLFNVRLAFDLLEDAGIDHRLRPEDVVNAEGKAVTRLLFKLFTKYKRNENT